MKQHPKVKRLKSKKSIARLFFKGNKVKTSVVFLFYLPSSKTQVTFSVPKKKVRLAVNRNRIKRQMREIYRKHQIETEKSYDLLFVFRKKTAISFHILSENMQKCLNCLPK